MAPQSEIHEIYWQALQCSTAEERKRYLEVACGEDKSLRQKIEQLLLQHNDAEAFWGGQEAPEIPVERSLEQTLSIGGLVGSYRLVRQLGEGGMGIVFEATGPEGDPVALKVLKTGPHQRYFSDRFDVEINVLQILDHPGIARILDSGQTDNGLKYIVMDLAGGISITKFCRVENLSLQPRLDLFCDVCTAVQHAHQQSVIHRDLKPSNILVERSNDRYSVKVIDFGIAKLLERTDEITRMLTALHGLVGTPMAMSPEQAIGDSTDTRSDIYSLGVLLYELVTDQTPFSRKRLRSVPYDELVRIIRIEEPKRASKRLETIQMGAFLRRRVRDELDWIIATAMAKDPNRRYQSVSELVADLKRFKAGDAVLARPPSWAYRMSRFVSAHPAFATSVAIVTLSLVSATWISVHYAAEADAARESAESARQLASEQAEAAAEAKKQAERQLYTSEMSAASKALTAGDVARVRTILDRHVPAANEPDRRGLEWHILNNATHLPFVWEYAGGSRVNWCSLSPDGLQLAAGTEVGLVIVLDATNGQEVQTHQFGATVTCVAWSPNGKHLAVGLDSGAVAVQRNSEPESHSSPGLLSNLKMLTTGVPSSGWESIAADKDQTNTVLFSRDGKQLYTAGYDRIGKVWDLKTGTLVRKLLGPARDIESLCLTPDGKRLLGASSDRYVYNWNVETGRVENQWIPEPSQWGRMLSVDVSADGEVVAGGNVAGTLTVTNADGNQLTTHLHLDPIEVVRVLQNPYRVIAADRSGTVSVWEVDRQNKQSQILQPPLMRWQSDESSVLAMDVNKAEEIVYSGHRSGRIVAWRLPDPLQIAGQGHARCIDVDHEGKLLVAGKEAVSLITDLPRLSVSESANASVKESEVPWNLVSASGASPRVVSASKKEVRVTDISTGKVVLSMPPDREPHRLAISPDGNRIAIADKEKRRFVEVIDFSNPSQPKLTTLPSRHCETIAFSPDGRQLVVGHLNSLRIHDSDSWKLKFQLNQHTATLASACFSPDGTLLASVGHDRELHIWSPGTGEHLRGRKVATDRIHSAAFSMDGSRIAMVGKDGFLRIVDSESLDPLLAYQLPSHEYCNQVRFGHDDTFLFVRTKPSGVFVIPAESAH